MPFSFTGFSYPVLILMVLLLAATQSIQYVRRRKGH